MESTKWNIKKHADESYLYGLPKVQITIIKKHSDESYLYAPLFVLYI